MNLVQVVSAITVALILAHSSQSQVCATGYDDSTSRPNIIVILADDLALGDLAHRNGGITRTPGLDSLADASVRFRNGYSGSCVCAPARAALLTGRYPHRTGVVTLNQERYPGLTRLRLDETTIAGVLHDHGYVTGLVGKWHCGIEPEYHPLKRGFDEFAGFIGPNSYWRYRLDVNGTVSTDNDGYLTEELSRRAIDFVRRHQHRPFFLHLAHYAPHRPLEAPKKLVDVFRAKGLNESTATIYAMVEVMDAGISALLSELDRLQLAAKTLVVFASDNGPDPITGTRFNEDRRGSKYEVYEGGIRVPIYFRWANRFEAGERDEPIHFVDLFPTILDVCGIDHKTDLPFDGVSLVDLLHGRQKKLARRLYWQWNRGTPNYTHNAAVRDGPWKLVRPFVTRAANPKNSDSKAVLYHLSDDGREHKDVSATYPDRHAAMLRELNRWSDEVEQSRTRAFQ